MINAYLYIDNKKYRLLNLFFNFSQSLGVNNKPSSIPRGGQLQLTIPAIDKDLELLNWTIHSTMQKKGRIEIMARDGGSMGFKMEFANAYTTSATYIYDSNSSDPMNYTITITAGILRINGDNSTIHKQTWDDGTAFDPPTPVTVIEENTPQIKSIRWMNTDTKEQNIKSISYKENASLQAVIQNPEGSTAYITIEKEDGSEFANGEKVLSFTESINDEGIVELTPLEIKEQWEEFKTSDIDKLIAKVIHGETSKTSNTLQIIPSPKVIVDFRPAKNYNGEYGFDYMRHKKDKDDSLTYKDILGINKTVKNPTTGEKTNIFARYTTDIKYNDLKNTHYNTTTFPWYKDASGKPIEYIKSWLTIYPKQKATISLQLETLDNPKKLDLSLEYDKAIFKLSTDVIPAQSKGKKRLKDHLEIECLKEFDTDQSIKVMYNKRQLGELTVLKNSKNNRYKTDIVFVETKTHLNTNKNTKEGKSAGEQSFLKKYLNQALISPNIVIESLDLTADKTFNAKFASKGKGYIDSRTGIHAYLNSKMNAKYKNYLKVYFIPDQCPGTIDKFGKILSRVNGQAMAIGADAVIVFDGHNKATTTQEALHALGIRHTFDNKATYGYKKGETYNIMDYSHQSKYGSKKRILTWLWQWKILWKNKLVKPE